MQKKNKKHQTHKQGKFAELLNPCFHICSHISCYWRCNSNLIIEYYAMKPITTIFQRPTLVCIVLDPKIIPVQICPLVMRTVSRDFQCDCLKWAGRTGT